MSSNFFRQERLVASIRLLETELETLTSRQSILPTSQTFDAYTREVRTLCDPIYTQQGLNARSRYHTLGVDLVEALIRGLPEEPSREDVGTFTVPDVFDEFLHNLDEVFVGGDPGFMIPTEVSPEMEGSAVAMAPTASTEPAPYHSTVNPTIFGQERPSITPSKMSPGHETGGMGSVTSSMQSAVEVTGGGVPGGEEGLSSSAAQQQKVEANSCCEICGYRPKGDPQWFKGSMAKHKKLQHSTDPPRIYKCSYPGCTSAYKNRPDNLRQHQIEKGHFVEGVDSTGRPAKRKKTSSD